MSHFYCLRFICQFSVLTVSFLMSAAELGGRGCVESESDQQEEPTEGGESGRACESLPRGDARG